MITITTKHIKDYDEKEAIRYAINTICNKYGETVKLTNSITGELLFSYLDGNVEWINGDFATLLCRYLVMQHDDFDEFLKRHEVQL